MERVEKHISEKRLLEVVQKGLTFTDEEHKHIKHCEDCAYIFSTLLKQGNRPQRDAS